MISTSLLFYISPRWKKNTSNTLTNNEQPFSLKAENLQTCDHHSGLTLLHNPHKTNHRYLTFNFNKNDPRIRTARDLNQVLDDIQTYSNQLHDTHGSISIQTHASLSKQCCCNQNQSTEICNEISRFENELLQNDFVEYVYQIESLANKQSFCN